MKNLSDTLLSFLEISKTLGNGLNTFLKIFFSFLYWKLIARKIFIFNFKFKGIKFKFYSDNRVDFAALDEIFVKKEYDFKYENMGDGSGKVIVDLGANVGDTAIFYSILFPKAKVFAVEPNTMVHEKLYLNTKSFENIKVCKYAVSDKTGKTHFNIGDSHLGSSLLERSKNNKKIEVNTYSFKDFLKNENIQVVDILKFDIEGGEEFLLKDLNIIKEKVKQLAGEMHDDLTTRPLMGDLDSLNFKNKEIKTLSNSRYIYFGS